MNADRRPQTQGKQTLLTIFTDTMHEVLGFPVANCRGECQFGQMFGTKIQETIDSLAPNFITKEEGSHQYHQQEKSSIESSGMKKGVVLMKFLPGRRR